MALAAYRNLLRSTRIAFPGILPLSNFSQFFPCLCFQIFPSLFFSVLSSSFPQAPPNHFPALNLISRPPCPGDFPVLHAARQSARQKFNEHRLLAPSSAEAEARIAYAEEIALVLRRNVVQGEQVDGTAAGAGVDGGKYRELCV